MNNIKLIKEFDCGLSRIRKPGELMMVDNATKIALIADGTAEAYSAKVEIKDVGKKKRINNAKAVQTVKSPKDGEKQL